MIHDCDVALEKHVAANASAVVLENAVLSSISSGLAGICSDVVMATRVNWSNDATSLVNSHRGMLSEVQRNSCSVDGVILSSQQNTAELLVSTEESVENSGDRVGSRVALDSERNTLVRDSPSDGSLSSFLGSVPELGDDHLSNVESDGEIIIEDPKSDSEAIVESERSPNATTLSDSEDRISAPPPSIVSKPLRGDRRNENQTDKDAEMRGTRSRTKAVRVNSSPSNE